VRHLQQVCSPLDLAIITETTTTANQKVLLQSTIVSFLGLRNVG
jgi:hypothetical protein